MAGADWRNTLRGIFIYGFVIDMSLLLKSGLLMAAWAGCLFGDVSYNETVRVGSISAKGPLERLPSIDPPIFDIPANLYARAIAYDISTEFRVSIKGNKLARTRKDVSTIFDLDARTVTVLQRKSHTYTIETFDSASKRLQEMYGRWFAPLTTETYSTKVERTGKTKVLDARTAEEFVVIAIGHFHGRNRVASRSVYWIVPQFPSEQAAQFQMRWAQECSLPFPGAELIGPGPFGAIAEAASKLGGYAVLRTTQSRPIPNAGNVIDAASYDASRPNIPQETIAGSYSMFTAEMARIHAQQTETGGFTSDSIADDIFAVPAGYKLKKGAAYLP